ncbi:MAG: hypothetical protein IJ638_02140 [Alphaproteobacteria bacterium]|nr:hypothetical protein [Alphaproteobacteria bacterium]
MKLQEKFEIKTYQCNEFGSMKLRHLFDCFQELAGDHADKIGVGYEECLKKNCAWVCAKYHVLIDKLPKFKDKIIIETYPSKFIGPTGIREFKVTDENGNILVKGVSQWVLIDLVRLRPLIVQNIFDCSKIELEEGMEIPLDKIGAVETYDFELLKDLRYDDVDVNHHINNAVYISLAEDALFERLGKEFDVSEISVDFKKSAVLSDKKVLIKSFVDGNKCDFAITKDDGSVDFARINLKLR